MPVGTGSSGVLISLNKYFYVMRKMRADSFADLLEMASRLRISPRRW